MAHQTSHEELARRVQEARTKVKVGELYDHWQNPGAHYRVLEVGFCEWDEVLCVIYQQVNVTPELVWVRWLEGKDGWLTPAVDDEGNERPRFVVVEK